MMDRGDNGSNTPWTDPPHARTPTPITPESWTTGGKEELSLKEGPPHATDTRRGVGRRGPLRQRGAVALPTTRREVVCLRSHWSLDTGLVVLGGGAALAGKYIIYRKNPARPAPDISCPATQWKEPEAELHPHPRRGSRPPPPHTTPRPPPDRQGGQQQSPFQNMVDMFCFVCFFCPGMSVQRTRCLINVRVRHWPLWKKVAGGAKRYQYSFITAMSNMKDNKYKDPELFKKGTCLFAVRIQM